MPEGSSARRGRTMRWAGFLSLAMCLAASGGGLGAEQRVPANATAFPPAASRATEVDLTPAPHDVIVRPGDPLNEALAGLGARLDELARLVGQAPAERGALATLKAQSQRLLARIESLEAERDRLPAALQLAKELGQASAAAHRKVQDLVEALIAERRSNAELGAALAVAKAERTKLERAARAKEAALVAWIDGLHDELAEREAQLTEAGAARAQREARLEAQARAAQAERARAARQLAAIEDQLRERDRDMASAQAESEHLRQRLNTAEAALERKGAENQRLAAALAARGAAELATVMAHDHLDAVENQVGTLHAGAGDAAPDGPQGPVSATLAGALPAMPYPKPRLEEDPLDAWAPAWDAADGDAHAAAIAVIEDGAWIQASVQDAAASAGAATTHVAPLIAPDSPEAGDVISTAALLADPFGSGQVPGGSAADHQSTPLLEWGDRAGLDAAAARLADGLRSTREEAMFQRQERVFTVDVEERAFAANAASAPVPLDPALDIRLFTARSELVGDGKGGIRFYPDGSSTGGRVELQLSGDRAAVNVRWSTGVVTVER